MNEKLIVLETKRLRIYCLELKAMGLLHQGGTEKQFEEVMGYSIGKLEGIDKELNDEFYKLAMQMEEQRLWFRLWDIVSVKDNTRIGGALFKGGPDESGRVEIGYGIKEAFQRQGYAKEAINELVHWALLQEGVTSVTAETDKDNIASQMVLQHIGMQQYAESDTDYLWSYPSL